MPKVLNGLTIISFLLFNVFTQAQAPKYSNEFLKLGVGAKSFGMGGAVTAMTNDVEAGYWNPAGLIYIKKKYDASLMHAEYFAGIIKYDYVGIAHAIDEKSVIAGSFIRLGVDGIPNTTQLIDAGGVVDFNRVTSFSVADNALLISYAREVDINKYSKRGKRKKTPLYNTEKRLSYGGSLKIIYRNIGEFANAWGFGFDLGGQYRNNGWLLGASLKDATSTFNAWNITLSDDVIEVFNRTNNEIPTNGLEITTPSLFMGAARTFKLINKFNITTALDLETTFDGFRNTLIKTSILSIAPKLGIEGSYNDLFFLRFGLSEFQQARNILGATETSFKFNLGLGIKFKFFEINYAFTDLGDNAVGLYSNIFSVRVMFDKL